MAPFEWTLIDIPDIEVNGDFYIGIFTEVIDPWVYEFWLGVSGGKLEGHHRSYYLNSTQNKVWKTAGYWDWMIRAIGNSSKEPLITNMITDKLSYVQGETINMIVTINALANYEATVGIDVLSGSENMLLNYDTITLIAGQTYERRLSFYIPKNIWGVGERTFKLWVYDPSTDKITVRNVITIEVDPLEQGKTK
jgi:hypothetical protein